MGSFRIPEGVSIGSYESYVRAILSRACTPVEEGGLGYRAAVINFRGCTFPSSWLPFFNS